VAAGFTDFEITWSANVFTGAARPSPQVEEFGTCGVNFRARKPG
jgi:hypothetical protein